jgi:hypothetical protein
MSDREVQRVTDKLKQIDNIQNEDIKLLQNAQNPLRVLNLKPKPTKPENPGIDRKITENLKIQKELEDKTGRKLLSPLL